MSSRPWR